MNQYTQQMNQYMSNTLTGLRSVDLNVRGLLERGFAVPSKKKVYGKNEAQCNIFCSDMITSAFIMNSLEEVSQSPKTIRRLEIEDLIAGKRHHSLIPEVERVIFTNDRDWESISFVDTIALADYSSWKRVKDSTMRSFEVVMGGMGSSKWREVIVWKATVEIPPGTSVRYMLRLLKTIKQDQDVTSISLRSAEAIVEGVEGFANILDWTTGVIRSQLVIELECGWSDSRNLRLLNCCIYALKHPARVDFVSKTHLKASNSSAMRRARSLGLQKTNTVCLGTISRGTSNNTSADDESSSDCASCPETSTKLYSGQTTKRDAPESESAALRRSSENDTPKKKKKIKQRSLRADSQDEETIMEIVESFKTHNKKRFSSTQQQQQQQQQGRSESPRKEPKKCKSDTQLHLRKEIQSLANLADLMAIKRTLDEAIADMGNSSTTRKEGSPDYDWELGVFLGRCGVSRAA